MIVRLLPAVLAAMAAVASGCSGGLPLVGGDDGRYLEAGEDLIEGDLADQIGLGPLQASCRGRGLGPGDAFACTALSGTQPPIEFVATISDDGESVDLTSANLLLADQVQQIESFAASLIAQDTGRPVTAESFECADSSLVVAPGAVVDCLVTDPTDGTIFDVAVTVDDLDTLSITVDVGEPIG